jgi:phosphatidylserine/phosphatidylglycerophosphate/cardiolipin synthase-like enzyme
LDGIVDRSRFRSAGVDGQARVLVPGRNCWRVETASRAAVLVDSAEFYRRLEQACRAAQHSIRIIGWDFDGRIRLRPDCGDECPSLGDFLRAQVDQKSGLRVDILIWSIATLHAPSSSGELLLGAPWQDHPRISVRLDAEHPLYASHHQKIICIDDALAFAGGIDLTVDRWDTCDHQETNTHRLLPDGNPYSPVHDVQMVVDGDAAYGLSVLARERWRRATGETLADAPAGVDPWPVDLTPEFTHVPVAISRTEPGWRDHAPVEEIAALTVDLLRAARRTIYIEAQYFASRNIRHVLEQSLLAREGPEIVVIVTRATHSLLERVFLGENRDRLMRRLRRADRHNRLRVYYPIVPGAQQPCDVLIHAKVMIIDDRFLRIGSANLNNRSMGLDTECDLVLEAGDAEARDAVAAVRWRLLGEHLGVAPEALARTVAQHDSLIRAIDALNRGTRGLRPYPEIKLDGPINSRIGTFLADPTRPWAPLWWRRRRRFRRAATGAAPGRRAPARPR